MEKLLFAFYGDDFTGSTDVMESIALQGVPTALFLSPPTADEVKNFQLKNSVSGESKKLGAYGIAGVSRSLTTEAMKDELKPVLEAVKKIPARFFQYKVCSTFDSSPQVGSIGFATDLAYEYFPSRYIPLLIGAPSLNRFCIFGNLFARVNGVTYRLDRHPTMSKHPVTPMHESDLRLHLAKQTSRKVHLMDLFSLEDEQFNFSNIKTGHGDVVLFDILSESHLHQAGKLIVENTPQEQIQLLVGSSGINYAILYYLQDTGQIKKPPMPDSPGKVTQMVVMAGSAAPPTQTQLEWVMGRGYEAIKIDTVALVDPNQKNGEMERILKEAFSALDSGKSIAMFTALGPEDEQIDKTRQKMNELKLTQSTSEIIAGSQGAILKEILGKTGLKRAVVAGGDTSGYVARALGIYALETLMPIAPGAPLCTAHSHDPAFDGLQISLKGGQNGNEKYFESIQMGLAV